MEEMIEQIRQIIDYLCDRRVSEREFYSYIENELGIHAQDFRLLLPELRKCGIKMLGGDVFLVENTPLSLPPNQRM